MLHETSQVSKDKCGLFSFLCRMCLFWRILDIKRGHERGQGSAFPRQCTVLVLSRSLGVSATMNCPGSGCTESWEVQNLDSCNPEASISQAVGRKCQCLQHNQSGPDKLRRRGRDPHHQQEQEVQAVPGYWRSRQEPFLLKTITEHTVSASAVRE